MSVHEHILKIIDEQTEKALMRRDSLVVLAFEHLKARINDEVGTAGCVAACTPDERDGTTWVNAMDHLRQAVSAGAGGVDGSA